MAFEFRPAPQFPHLPVDDCGGWTPAGPPCGGCHTCLVAQGQRPEPADEDPRGDAACPECPEGEVIPLGFSRFGVTVAVCNVCGFQA